jgi:Mg2+/citrate symporter
MVGVVVPVQEIFCSALASLVGPVQTIFFLTDHYFISFLPIAQQAGQAAVLGRLSLCMCLWPGRFDFKGRHKLPKMKI